MIIVLIYRILPNILKYRRKKKVNETFSLELRKGLASYSESDFIIESRYHRSEFSLNLLKLYTRANYLNNFIIFPDLENFPHPEKVAD